MSKLDYSTAEESGGAQKRRRLEPSRRELAGDTYLSSDLHVLFVAEKSSSENRFQVVCKYLTSPTVVVVAIEILQTCWWWRPGCPLAPWSNKRPRLLSAVSGTAPGRSGGARTGLRLGAILTSTPGPPEEARRGRSSSAFFSREGLARGVRFAWLRGEKGGGENEGETGGGEAGMGGWE